MTPPASRVLFLCVCAALVGYEGYRFYGTTVSGAPTVLIQGEQPILMPEFGDGVELTQAFGMIADGLRGVSVQLTSDRPATLQVSCELQQVFNDMPGTYAEIYNWTTTLRDVSGTQWRRFDFPQVAASAGRSYAFRIRVLESKPLVGKSTAAKAAERPRVAIAGFSDNVRRGGILWVAGVRQVGSLHFQAHGDGETAYERFRLGVGPRLPWPLRNQATQLVFVLILHWALLTTCHAMLFEDPERREWGI
jgi:hypothetical protein